MSLEKELTDLVGKWAPAPVEPPVQTQEPVVAPAAISTPTPAPVEPVVPKVEPTATKKEEPKVDLEAVVDSWDIDATPATPSAAVAIDVTNKAKVDVPYFDFSEVAKVLNTEVKSKDDIIKAISEYKTKVDQINADQASLPQPLLKAIEIARQNGNYLEYLGVSRTDWSKKDPVEVYEDYVVDRLTDPATGQVDYEKVDQFLDKIDDVEKEIRGKELISSYSNYQSQMLSSIEREAADMKARQDAALRQALNTVEDVAGFKLSQAHKDDLYNWYNSGQMWKDLFHDASGNIDFKKVVTNGFISKYWGKLDNFRKQQIKNAAKREILEELQQPSLTTSTEPAQVDSSKPYNLDDYLKELKKSRGFT